MRTASRAFSTRPPATDGNARIDHGYFQGPTTGLERDLSIVPLLPSCDALSCRRGILRSLIPAQCTKPKVLRASGGASILREELSDEQIAMGMEDAVRLNAAGVGPQRGHHEVFSTVRDFRPYPQTLCGPRRDVHRRNSI
jgi:hypothetical protein